MSELLNETSVIVWLLSLDPPPSAGVMSACIAVLDAEERARAARFLNEPARKQFVVAHAAVRHLLSSVSDVKPGEWQFEKSVHGKPSVAGLAARADLQFNLAHTDRLVACVLSTAGSVGIDIEAVRPAVTVRDFERLLSDAEQQELNALSGSAQARRFYAIWAAKEAYAKAIGVGLSESLRTVTIEDAETAPRIAGDRSGAGWRLRRLGVGRDHAAVVAIGCDAPLVVRRVDPAELCQ